MAQAVLSGRRDGDQGAVRPWLARMGVTSRPSQLRRSASEAANSPGEELPSPSSDVAMRRNTVGGFGKAEYVCLVPRDVHWRMPVGTPGGVSHPRFRLDGRSIHALTFRFPGRPRWAAVPANHARRRRCSETCPAVAGREAAGEGIPPFAVRGGRRDPNMWCRSSCRPGAGVRSCRALSSTRVMMSTHRIAGRTERCARSVFTYLRLQPLRSALHPQARTPVDAERDAAVVASVERLPVRSRMVCRLPHCAVRGEHQPSWTRTVHREVFQESLASLAEASRFRISCRTIPRLPGKR